ncbi:glycosyltransferase family A protein [Dysgonomonas sp. 25]|uniref:glycosyltransferase family 2 protein n=1 Tax=Dysgonomonas sp. 25 TaxID=2302933 RepID=UPI0013D50BE6|nr:glycosyltransferase family A protein [Dysgonomonas sp. 25]NDV69035.1 glycosyltransferase family 2 protein [Dysgonomonas sp. 25]
MQPLVSIIVPCYNQAPYLDEALQSVLDQEYSNWECIIVNDGSADNSEEVALKWVEKNKRFKYFYKENSGVSATRNFAFNQSEGKYILPLDGDDKISQSYISEAVDIFEKDADVKIIYCNTIFFGVKEGKHISPEYKFENMFLKNPITNSSMFRRDVFPPSGYNENMRDGLEDWDFWLSIIDDKTKVVKLNDFHLYYRIKEISRSTLVDREKNEKLLIQLFRNHQEKYLRYFNPLRDHIEADQFKREVIWLKEQPQWRIGSIVYKPFELIGKAWKKIVGKKKRR